MWKLQKKSLAPRSPEFVGDLFVHQDNLAGGCEPYDGMEVELELGYDKRGRLTGVILYAI